METTGNFLKQPNRDFPLDCETLEALQDAIRYACALGNMGGDKTILCGCKKPNRLIIGGNKTRGEGLVFLCTKDHPDGEILRWTGGDTSSGMHVVMEDVAVEAQGYRYEKAYTMRRLEPGLGEEWYDWAEFSEPMTKGKVEKLVKEVETKIDNLRAALVPEPAGCIKLWSGQEPPEGYILCDGRALKISEYDNLYAVIGKTYNDGVSAGGTVYETQSGYFRIPDLRGRFVVGTWEESAEYNKNGRTGGENKHELTGGELPSHKHSVNDYYYAEAAAYIPSTGAVNIGKNVTGGRKSDDDNCYLHYHTHDTAAVGSGYAHENRPPYYSLTYIIKY